MTGMAKLTDAERRSTELLSPLDVARQYGLGLRTQEDLRSRGEFIPVIHVGLRRLFYRREALEKWLDDHTDPQPAEARALQGAQPKAAETAVGAVVT